MISQVHLPRTLRAPTSAAHSLSKRSKKPPTTGQSPSLMKQSRLSKKGWKLKVRKCPPGLLRRHSPLNSWLPPLSPLSSRQPQQPNLQQLHSCAPRTNHGCIGHYPLRGHSCLDRRKAHLLEKMCFCSWYTSLTHMSEELGQDPREIGASRVGSLLSDNQCLLTSSGPIPEWSLLVTYK